MSSDSENEEMCAPLVVVLEDGKINSVPEKSRKKYETSYSSFMEWRSTSNIDSFSEDVLLDYFKTLSEKYKSSSLWSQYSMLRSTLNINNNINIERYSKLRAFLKRISVGYQANKSKIFTPYEINKFINEAPDFKYLATKVALIMGITGACQTNQLHSMNVEDFQDLGSALLVRVPNTKTNRRFTITGNFYQICKKYADLRPSNVETNSFFLNYVNGKCTTVNIGINKFGAMGKQIATYLNLPNPEMYTGRSFRKSSATLYVDADGDLTALKRPGEWSAELPENYMDDDPIHIKEEIEDPVGEPAIYKIEDGFSESMDDTYGESLDGSFAEPVKNWGNDEGVTQRIGESVQQSTMNQSTIGESVANSTSGESIKPSEVKRSSINYVQNLTNESINIDLNSTPSVHFINCSNITINFITNESHKPK